jgi:hypothetical protein
MSLTKTSFHSSNQTRIRSLSRKTHGGLRLVSRTQPLNATTRTLSGSDVRTSRWCCHSDGGNGSGSDVRTPHWCPKICKTLSSKYIHCIIIIIIIIIIIVVVVVVSAFFNTQIFYFTVEIVLYLRLKENDCFFFTLFSKAVEIINHQTQ